MNSQNPNNEFSSPSEDLLDTSYSDNSYSSILKEDTNNLQSHNQNFVEYCTENTLENGVSPLENASNFYQPVDDYSLYYIYSRGIQYLANLKQNEKSNNASVMSGNPSNNQMKLIAPMLKSLDEAHSERSFGENQKHPGISRYAGHLEALLRLGPRPHQIGNTAGGFNYKEEPIRAYDAVEISNKFQIKSSTTNVLLPCYNKDDLKEVTRDEYCNALKCKSKGIFKGTSAQLGLSRFSPKQSDYEKWKALLLNSQNYKDSQATDIPSIGLNGNGKWMQTNNNFIKQAVENYWISSQLSQGSRNRDVQANPSFNFSTGSGEMTGKCNRNSENVVLLYCGENIFPGTWEEFGSVRLVDNDFYIVPVPQNEVVGIPDHTISCTKQVIDIGFGEKANGFTSGGNLDSNSTIDESSQINALSCMENSEQVTNPEYGDLEFFKQVQDEFTCSSSDWIDNMLLPPGFLGHDE